MTWESKLKVYKATVRSILRFPYEIRVGIKRTTTTIKQNHKRIVIDREYQQIYKSKKEELEQIKLDRSANIGKLNKDRSEIQFAVNNIRTMFSIIAIITILKLFLK